MKRTMIFLVAFTIGAAAAAAMADSPTTVTRQKIRSNTGGTNVEIITRKVVEPDATVDRPLAEQPVMPHLIEAKMGTMRVLLDPQKNYYNPNGVGHLDGNHSLLKAQSAAIGQRIGKVTIIRGTRAKHQADHAKPAMILYRWDLLEKQLKEKQANPPNADGADVDRADENHAPAPDPAKKKMANAD